MKIKKLANSVALKAGVAIFAATLGGCNSGGSSAAGAPTNGTLMQTNTVKQKTGTPKLGDDLFISLPGSAYDTSTNTAVSNQSCLVATQNSANIQISKPSGFIHYGDNVSLSTLENILGISIDGPLGGGVFSNTTSAYYLKNAKANAYKLNFNYIYQYAGLATFIPGSIGEGLSALTPIASALASGTNPAAFRKVCGDSFISQMNAGELLGLTISLRFNSNLDKELFTESLTGNETLSTIMNSITTAQKKSRTSIQMGVYALQFGGDAAKLETVFNPLACSNVNSTTCQKMINNVIKYADSLPAQITNSDGNIKKDKVYYMSPISEKYSTIGVNVNAPDPSSETVNAAQQIVKMYDEAQNNLQFAQQYSNLFRNYLSPNTYGTLADAIYHYQNQFNDLYFGQNYDIVECFRGYMSSNCVQVKNNIESALATSPYHLSGYDTELLNYLKSSSYEGKIYNYTGNGSDESGDYSLQSCVFSPVSSSYNSQYVLYCGAGSFLPITSSGLTITQSAAPTGTQLDINGLQYGAINPLYPSYQKQINYPDSLTLTQESGTTNDFEIKGIHITGGSSFSTSTGKLSLFQIPAEEN